ncbi:MAG: hypothetical protein IKU76_08355 [Bacteroidaceae bacterium]|nr:hypothetical protein [Bacteroidaceae bacterium]
MNDRKRQYTFNSRKKSILLISNGLPDDKGPNSNTIAGTSTSNSAAMNSST